jgi:hypothetical protein
MSFNLYRFKRGQSINITIILLTTAQDLGCLTQRERDEWWVHLSKDIYCERRSG